MSIVNAALYWLGVAVATLGTIGLVLLFIHELIERAFRLKDHYDLFIEFCAWRSERKRRNGSGPLEKP